MKILKRWLAFFVVVVLLIGVAFNSRGPLIASQVDGTTEGAADPSAASADGEQQAPEGGEEQQPSDIQDIQQTDPGQTEGQEQVQDPAASTPETEEPKAEEPKAEEEKKDEEAPVHQDAVELKQDLTDENNNVICTVTANIPEGTFEANTSDVTMEVGYAAADTAEQIKALIEKNITAENQLGEYFLYNVVFKVKGEQVEPGKEIKITFEPKDFKIKDTKKATTFFYNEANSPAGNAEAEIVGITQKADKIKELQDAGQSIDTVDDDYDLSEISLREDGTAEKIMMEGRRSTIYGCYVEEKKPEEPKAEEPKKEEPAKDDTKATEQVLKYEDDDVKVQVSADKEGIIPEGATLQVVPIKKDAEETQDQYKEVEEKIQEKASEEEYEIAGFLAYDISFIDKDGNKVEPDGEVKVSMEYKKAVLPEEVDEEKAKDAEVTVLHLEEDEKGEVKDVVDMTAEGNNEAAVEKTEDAKVTKAEFVTESFSYFTVAWKIGYYDYKAIDIKFVNEAGYEIQLPEGANALEKIELSYTAEFEMSEISESGSKNQIYAITDKNGQKYTFKKAVNDWYWEDGNISGTEILALKYKNSQIKWKDKDGEYHDHDNRDTFYFMYAKVEEAIKQVPTVSDNIRISLYNYNRNIVNPNINTLQQYGFGFYSGNGEKDGSSDYSGTFTNSNDQGLSPGIVRHNLKDGVPALNNAYGSSLGYLFGKKYNQAVDKYEGLSGLFQKDENGYYFYDSLSNAAVLDGNEIKVYDGTVSGDDFNYGNFLPFNNQYINGGTNLLNKIPRKDTDMWFGMNVGMSFYQPRDGRINNQDMQFEFRGDDDVWVFIDGMLVLDLGGIHGKLAGSINFNTGVVVANGEQTTLADSYYDAYREQGLSRSEAYENLAKIFNKQGGKYTSFKNYSSHKFEFFYLERGGGASNCKIKFNMPRLPEESVMVTKEVVNKDDESVDYSSDIEFRFNIKKNNEILSNTNYLVYENSQQVGDGKTNESGEFTLKHGQSAVFEGFRVTDNYEVKELGAYLDGYNVWFENKILIKDSETEGTTTIESVTTGKLEVDKTSSVVFKNEVTNTGTLFINKILSSGSDELIDKEFPVQVAIQGKLYKGSYTRNDKVYNTTDGIIYIKKGEEVKITGLPYGTSFEILERQDGSYLPTYTISGQVYDKVLPEYDAEGVLINGISSASGKIAGDSKVEIENSAVKIQTGTTSVEVTKTWRDSKEYDLPEYVEVTLYEDTNRNKVYDDGDDILVKGMGPQKLNENNHWKAEWLNLPADVDYVVKETYPEGYELFKTIITNSITEVTPVGDGGKHSTNSTTVFNLGKNNILLVKETSGGGKYFLWTPYDLGLSNEDITEIVKKMSDLIKDGAGNLGKNNITYKYGEVVGGISMNETANGWQLKFIDTSIWSLFWDFSYNRTEKIELENRIDEDLKTQLIVNKEWQGDIPSERPNHVTVQLYKNGEPTDTTVEINRDSEWKHTFENLDYYSYDETVKKYIKNEYSVKEIKIGDEDVDENGQAKGYQSNVIKNEDGSFTIINAKEWQIVKVSDQSNEIRLKGAVFKLWTGDLTGSLSKPIYGKSKDNGVVAWYKDAACQNPIEGSISDGVYNLSEEQAPAGYSKSGEVWTITINNGGITNITSNTGKINSEQLEGKWIYYYKDSAVYDLPSAGGPGIFWYTVGGTLLMCLAGLLALYKNKHKRGANIS